MNKLLYLFFIISLNSCSKDCLIYETRIHNNLFDKTVEVKINGGLLFDQCKELNFRDFCKIETDFKIETITFKDRFGNEYFHEVNYNDCSAFIRVVD